MQLLSVLEGPEQIRVRESSTLYLTKGHGDNLQSVTKQIVGGKPDTTLPFYLRS